VARESISSVVIRRSSGCSKQRQDRSPSIDGSRYFWRRKQMLFATVRLVRLWRRMCHFENAQMRDPAERVLWRLTLCSYGLRASHILDANTTGSTGWKLVAVVAVFHRRVHQDGYFVGHLLKQSPRHFVLGFQKLADA